MNVNALLIALTLHCANLLLRTKAWYAIISAAFPRDKISKRMVLGAYVAGVGINAFAPARGGDVVKIATVRNRVAGSSVPALTSSLLAETVFDFAVATSADDVGVRHGPPAGAARPAERAGLRVVVHRPAHPGRDDGDRDRVHRRLAAAALARAPRARVLAAHRAGPRDPAPAAPLLPPASSLYQALGWCCRLGTAYFLLEAFDVHATITNALLVLVVGSISTLLPITPGGAGAQQALLVIVLAGQASSSSLLAYSVGAQVAVTAFNALLGAAALFLLFGSVRFRHIRAEHA